MTAAVRRAARGVIVVGGALLLFVFLALAHPLGAAAATITVNTTNDNVTAGDGACTLREAIANVNAVSDTTGGDCAAPTGTDIIVFNSSGTGTIKLTNGILTVDANVTIQGPGAGVLAIDGGCTAGCTTAKPTGGVTIFQIGSPGETPPVVVAISGLTIQHGNGFGGCGCGFAGGLINYATLTLTRVTFLGNGGGTGGAITNDFSASLTVTESTFTGNAAVGALTNFQGFGGAIANIGTLIVSGSTFTDNAAPDGGAVANLDTAQVENSTFFHNSATDGGAVENIAFEPPPQVTLLNDTLVGNTATRGGGVDTSVAPIITATKTSSAFARGGVGTARTTIRPAQVPTSNTALVNTIVAGNSGGDIGSDGGALTTDGENNLIGDGSGGLSAANGNQLGTTAVPLSPLLAPLGNYGGPTRTMTPLPGSPVIDMGADDICGPLKTVTTDQREVTRPQGAHCDIGAVESQGFTLNIVPGGTPQTAAVGKAFEKPLAVTVSSTHNEPVAGGLVTFTVSPATNGASATLATSPATIGASGTASVTATANLIAGGPYAVTATTINAAPAPFALLNVVPTIIIAPASLPAGAIKGVSFTPVIFTATGGTGPYIFSVPPGTLPPGLTLAANGTLSGTPTATGPFTFTVTATDTNGFTGTQQYTLTLVPPALVSIAVTYKGSSTPTLKVGQVAPFIAIGTYQDGSTPDITKLVTWSGRPLPPTTPAQVDATGTVTASAPGPVTITATLSGITGAAMVTVGTPTPVGIVNPPPNPPAGRLAGTASTVGIGSPAPAPAPSAPRTQTTGTGGPAPALIPTGR